MDPAELPSADPTTTPTTTSEPASPPADSSSPADSPSPRRAPSIAGETAAVFKQLREKTPPAGSPPADPTSASPAQAARAPDAAGEAEPPARGPIPFDRHQAVLTRARREAREEAERELRQKFGWAERLNPQEAEQGTALIRWLQADPEGALSFLQRQRQASAPAAPAAPTMPEPDVVLGDGSKFYSAQGVAKLMEWRDQQVEERINGRFGPLLQKVALSELKTQAQAEATQAVQYYRTTFPMFKDLEKDIKALCLKNPNLPIEHAYAIALREKGLPSQRAAWDAERTGQLARKAAASSVQPGTPRPATPRSDREKTPKEVAREVFNRLAAG